MTTTSIIVQKITLADQIAQQIETSIVGGELAPGEKLAPERQLAKRLEVSRPSLREAIKKLASKGLLHSRQGGGTYVSAGCSADADGFVAGAMVGLHGYPESGLDILEVRHALDGQAAHHAAMRANQADRDKIRAAFERLVNLHDSGDVAEGSRADADFHLAIAEASQNFVLLQVTRGLMNTLLASVERNAEVLSAPPDMLDKVIAQHEMLMKAVLEGEAEGARQAAQAHVDYVEESLQQGLQIAARHRRFLRQVSTAERAVLTPVESHSAV